MSRTQMMPNHEPTQNPNSSEITELFNKVKSGDEPARETLISYLYQELKKIASSRRMSFNESHTLNTTALVNETWLKLKKSDMAYNDKNHFLSIAALAMRQILLDDSKRKSFLKQQGYENIEPVENQIKSQNQQEAEWLHQLDLILKKLENHSPRLALVFNLKFFCGLSHPELAQYFDVSEKTVQRDWQKVKSIVANTIQLLNN